MGLPSIPVPVSLRPWQDRGLTQDARKFSFFLVRPIISLTVRGSALDGTFHPALSPAHRRAGDFSHSPTGGRFDAIRHSFLPEERIAMFRWQQWDRNGGGGVGGERPDRNMGPGLDASTLADVAFRRSP